MNRRPGRASFENDDYSRYSGPDFHQDYSEARTKPANLDSLSSGVSSKDREEGSWFNPSQYQNQKNFIGKGPRGYQRQDALIQEDACEALTHDPLVDASEIEVEVQSGVITLRGIVPDRPSKRRAEVCVEDLSGVQDVINHLRIASQNQAGTQGMIKNQSGLAS